MMKQTLLAVSLTGLAALAVPQSAGAAPVLMSWSDWSEYTDQGNPNDCSGVFGTGAACDVGGPLGLDISPIVSKYNTGEGGGWTLYENYPSIDGSEFDGSDFLSSDETPGTWVYNPGEDDPAIRYWTGKGGNEGFTLYWYVEGTTVGDACDTVYSASCLDLALSVTTGTYDTPTGQGLSHISFYDTDGPGGGGDVPEPATLALLGFGLIGAGYARRRRS